MSGRRRPALRCGCGSTEFHVEYRVPVYAVVSEGVVVQVVVDDEAIGEPIGAACARCDSAARQGGEDPCAEARVIAEHSLWPGWDFGW